MNKPFLIIGLLFLAIASLLAYGAIVVNAVPVSTVAENEKTTASFTGIPCDEENLNELPKDMSEIAHRLGYLAENQNYSPATDNGTALFSANCNESTTTTTTVCSTPMVSGTSQTNCINLSCYTTTHPNYITYTHDTGSTYNSQECSSCNGGTTCKWARINFSRNVTKQYTGVLGQGVTCSSPPTGFPSSCNGISLTLFEVTGRRNVNGSWETAPCTFYYTPVFSNSCVTSGSLNDCSPVDAELCSAPITTVLPPVCISDLLNQELNNGHCRRV